MLHHLALLPKLANRIRGGAFALLVRAAGGQCGRGLRLERGLRLRQGLHPGLCIGADVYIGRNVTLDCLRGATLAIGDNTTLTEAAFISVASAVSIGRDVLIGEYCSIRDANHQISDLALPIAAQPMTASAITIADNVWIGRGCAILAGVSIDSGAVVGANSVVTRAVAANTIVAGAPARLISQRG